MTRHRFFRIVLGTALCLGLAGPAMGTGLNPEGAKKLPPGAPIFTHIGPPAPFKVVEVTLVGERSKSCAPTDCYKLTATITKAGPYNISVLVKNLSPTKNSSSNRQVTVNVTGNYNVSGYPYAKLLTKKIGAPINPNGVKLVFLDLGTLNFAPNSSATYEITATTD